MKQYFLNVHKMHKTVLSLLDENTAAWQDIPAITESVVYIRQRSDAIGAAGKDQQDYDTKGYTATKESAFDTLTAQAYKIALRVKIFARKEGNLVLLQKVDFSKTEIAAGSVEEVLNRCVSIAEMATAHAAALAAYNVKPGDLAALNAAIEAARPTEEQRDVARSKRSEATASIPTLFAEVNKKLLELDEEMEGLIDDEKLVAQYFEARRVNNVGEKVHGEAKPA